MTDTTTMEAPQESTEPTARKPQVTVDRVKLFNKKDANGQPNKLKAFVDFTITGFGSVLGATVSEYQGTLHVRPPGSLSKKGNKTYFNPALRLSDRWQSEVTAEVLGAYHEQVRAESES